MLCPKSADEFECGSRSTFKLGVRESQARGWPGQSALKSYIAKERELGNDSREGPGWIINNCICIRTRVLTRTQPGLSEGSDLSSIANFVSAE